MTRFRKRKNSKFEKSKKEKNREQVFWWLKLINSKKSGFLSYTCVCVCVKDENMVISQGVDAIKYQKMPFKGIFSPVERFSLCWWVVVRVG